MTREEAVRRLEELSKESDIEKAHRDADVILCQLLEALGMDDVVRAYDRIEMWYA